ncbi:hypothetical protein A0H81_08879 [Grifola frondosa]|uniref:Uncharacterized protein n=1 Tax=Grifola frondosa TaxID=5627 RepID=A0A1C7M451_GRIFR|nr:hypothetical protein A0H81_08879 [Grifola frondosa]
MHSSMSPSGACIGTVYLQESLHHAGVRGRQSVKPEMGDRTSHDLPTRLTPQLIGLEHDVFEEPTMGIVEQYSRNVESLLLDSFISLQTRSQRFR